MRTEVFTAVKMSVMFFWVMMPCGLAGKYQHFGKTMIDMLLDIQKETTSTKAAYFARIYYHIKF
jgi:hypothetical protein